ncbi:MAG: WD40 repeat domain-containing protein [Candidatus Electrothrix sp. AX5]|nr:WD40 repeat domain-containing protein [Candidatus Electrothrix sp. AX5]
MFNKDETRILTWSKDNTARLWDSGTGRAALPPLKHEQGMRGAAFNKDETRILTWSDEGTVMLWDSSTGKTLLPPLKHKKGVRGAVFNKDETKILIWSSDGTARVWDISVDTEWPSDKVVLKTEVETGTEMTAAGEVKALSAAAWRKKKWCEYDEIRYRLKRISKEEWQNSQRLCGQLKSPEAE